MKKSLQVAFTAAAFVMVLSFVACGDDSSSGPEEESTSFVELEDESSSSENISSSSSKKVSSSSSKKASSSSSKKVDSSSSKKASSSSNKTTDDTSILPLTQSSSSIVASSLPTGASVVFSDAAYAKWKERWITQNSMVLLLKI